MFKWKLAIVGLCLPFIGVSLNSGFLGGALKANPVSEPGRDLQDSAKAINNPDEYAWRLFMSLNWPADMEHQSADTSKLFGANGPVVWESWRNARDIYLPDGADPGPWNTLVAVRKSVDDFDAEPLQQQLLKIKMNLDPKIMFDPHAAQNQINETRLNREAFEFVRSKGLYNLNGQIALAKTGAETISFPLLAKEIKAQWRIIKHSDKPRYHWVTLTDKEGETVIYGLTALHITTKDLPNWFWATFEHVDNPTRPDNEPWMVPSHDTFACGNDKPDCNKAPSGIGLEGTKWQNYRLRGTQVDFTTSRGRTTILANSQPEESFQTTSSCITCHARASIDVDGDRLSIFLDSGEGPVGPVDSKWFSKKDAEGKNAITQLDFVWSMFRARAKQ